MLFLTVTFRVVAPAATSSCWSGFGVNTTTSFRVRVRVPPFVPDDTLLLLLLCFGRSTVSTCLCADRQEEPRHRHLLPHHGAMRVGGGHERQAAGSVHPIRGNRDEPHHQALLMLGCGGWSQESLDQTVITQVQPNNTFVEAAAEHQKRTLRKRDSVLKAIK
jgi:hypothetical protein